MTQGIQQERGFQITQPFLPAIEAVFAHAEQTANRIDPQPLIERLQNQHDLRKRSFQESSRGIMGLRKTVLTFRAPIELTNSASFERVALPGL